MGLARCFDPGRRFKARQVEGMPSLIGELFKVVELRPPVPLAERMHIVHIADDNGRRRGEGILGQSSEKIRFHQPAVNIGHSCFDELSELELLVALSDFDGAQFARPFVHILEQMPVNGPEVCQVKVSRGHTLAGALDHESTFHAVQGLGIGDAKLVQQDGRAGIGVGIVAGHSAASDRALSRI